MTAADESAFPQTGNAHTASDTVAFSTTGGLTKRELFSAIVMAKIARSTLAPDALKVRAQIAVAHADALLAELARGQGGGE